MHRVSKVTPTLIKAIQKYKKKYSGYSENNGTKVYHDICFIDDSTYQKLTNEKLGIGVYNYDLPSFFIELIGVINLLNSVGIKEDNEFILKAQLKGILLKTDDFSEAGFRITELRTDLRYKVLYFYLDLYKSAYIEAILLPESAREKVLCK